MKKPSFLLFLLHFVISEQSRVCFTEIGTSISLAPGAIPVCKDLSSTLISCSTGPSSFRTDCFCKQAVFDDIYECENEVKFCLKTNVDPSQLEVLLSEWHKECDTAINFSPTTPSQVSLTSTFNTNLEPVKCTSIFSVCAFGTASLLRCSLDFPSMSDPGRFSSCVCQEPLISAASVCEYDGNKTCLRFPAALTNIDVWNYCPKQASSFLHAHPASATAVTSGSTIPPLPTGSSSLGRPSQLGSATKTSTTTSSPGASTKLVPPSSLVSSYSMTLLMIFGASILLVAMVF